MDTAEVHVHRPGLKRSGRRSSIEMPHKKSIQNQLSIISEKSDKEFLLDDEYFDANEILRHLSSICSENSDSIEAAPEISNEIANTTNEELLLPDTLQPSAKDEDRQKISRRISDISELRPGRRRGSRVSLPNLGLGPRQDSTSSLKFNLLPGEWRNVFNSLDKKDGHKDGRLHKKSLQNILHTLETNSTWSLEYRTGQMGDTIMRQISLADQDKNGYLDKDEFADFVARLDMCELDAKEQQVNHVLTGHIKTAAYAGECRLCPPPLFILLVTLLQLGTFVYHTLRLADLGESMAWDGPAPLCSSLIYSPFLREQAWRFLTYSLVHSGFSHLVLNLAMQLAVGLPLECGQGTIRTALVYVLGVLAGSLATTCLDPTVYLAGASGGVYSLILAHLSTLILNWKEDVLIVRPKVWRKSGQRDKTAAATHGTLIRMLKLTAVTAFTVVDTGMAVYNKHMYMESNTTGYTAHIAGAAAGLVVGFFALENRRVQKWEVKLKIASFVATVALLGLAVLWSVFGDSWYSAIYGVSYFPLPTADRACAQGTLFRNLN